MSGGGYICSLSSLPVKLVLDEVNKVSSRCRTWPLLIIFSSSCPFLPVVPSPLHSTPSILFFFAFAFLTLHPLNSLLAVDDPAHSPIRPHHHKQTEHHSTTGHVTHRTQCLLVFKGIEELHCNPQTWQYFGGNLRQNTL